MFKKIKTWCIIVLAIMPLTHKERIREMDQIIGVYQRLRLLFVWSVIFWMTIILVVSTVGVGKSYQVERLKAQEFAMQQQDSSAAFGRLQEQARSTEIVVAGILDRQNKVIERVTTNEVLLRGVIDDVHSIFHITYSLLVGLLLLILKEGMSLLEVGVRRSRLGKQDFSKSPQQYQVDPPPSRSKRK